MRVKIISDGTSLGTRVVDAETGEILEGIVGLSWVATARSDLTAATITLMGVPVELESDAISVTEQPA
jgi:hypothetical protein